MKSPKVLIINRNSVVAGAPLSRSVEERLYEPLLYLKQKNDLEFEVLSENQWQEVTCSHYSHIVLNRAHSENSLRLIENAKKNKVKVISDLDDIPVYFPEGDKAYLASPKREYFFEALALSDGIVCSTEKIMRWVLHEYPRTPARVIKTGFDFSRIDKSTRSPISYNERTIVLTNAGSLKLGSFSSDWLQCIKEVLNRTQWRLGVFADSTHYFPEDFPLINFGSIPWFDHKTVVNKAFPLAVVPLASSEAPEHLLYSQYKTPVKYIIYGGLGVPCVYSKSPIYELEVEHNITGVLTENTSEGWTEALISLIQSPEQRTTLALNASRDVRDRYGIEEAGRNWLNLLHDHS